MTDKTIDKCIEVLNNSIIYSQENVDDAVQFVGEEGYFGDSVEKLCEHIRTDKRAKLIGVNTNKSFSNQNFVDNTGYYAALFIPCKPAIEDTDESQGVQLNVKLDETKIAKKIKKKIKKLEKQYEDLAAKVDALNGLPAKFNNLAVRFDNLNKYYDRLSTKLDAHLINHKFD